MTFTSRDLRYQVVTTSEGAYDVDAIVDEIQETYGTVDINTIDHDAFWAIVLKHALTSVYYQVEMSDKGEIWMLENDDARGTVSLDGTTPSAVACDTLANRLIDLEGEGAPYLAFLRVRVWPTADHASGGLNGDSILAEETHIAPHADV